MQNFKCFPLIATKNDNCIICFKCKKSNNWYKLPLEMIIV